MVIIHFISEYEQYQELICKQTDSDRRWHAQCIMRYIQVRGRFQIEISTSDNISQGKDFG